MTSAVHTSPVAGGNSVSGTRGFWPLRDLPVVGWLVAAVLVSLVHPFVPAPRWLMIHLLVLGAAGHAILVWSRYFADTLIRLPPTPRREQSQRLALFNLGVLVVIVGVPAGLWWPVVGGAVLTIVAVGWHVASLARGLRTGFASRFVGTLRFYLVAGAILPVGVTLGVWMLREPGEPLETRLRVAHVAVNLLGWIGLTVLGTVVTLGPTMLRTRILPGAEHRARQALTPLCLGIGVIVVASMTDRPLLAALGLLLYATGVVMVGWPLVRAARHKPPSSFPTWSMTAGLAWFAGLLVTLAGSLTATTADVDDSARAWASAGEAVEVVTPLLAVGFVAQVLLGALSYLVPVVLGGGPAAVRRMNQDLDAGGALRVVLVNLGLLVCALPVPSLVRVLTSFLVLGALVAFIPILVFAIRRRHLDASQRRSIHAGALRPRGQNAGLAALGVAAVMIAVALGGALDPPALDGAVESAGAGVSPTGRTVSVTIEAANMRFTPSRIELNAGDRLMVTVRNSDDSDVHDLVLETGHDSGRLAPGESAIIDVGVVGRDLDGWCSVVGHRQMGMTLTIVATGAPRDAETASTEADDRTDHTTHDPRSAGSEAEPASSTEILEPALPPIGPGQVHRYTFTVTEQTMEVAPGVTQEVWTYNGTSPGPVLHGRLGDTFVITLINKGTIGHSIDFHAGQRAPDQVMRTVPPGGSLTYRFTAGRSGIWMYHCSTMPMSAHIANGLFGAVVIDPPGLPEVDRSYVLIQSEHYYGPQGEPVDVDKLLAEQPDAVVFNGYRDAYGHRPIRVRVGERVRIWLLDAGPNRPLSFHVVGGQFDRTFAEGRWLLGSAGSPARFGGSQSLALSVAQGGFVEMVLREPGSYPLVNHVMVDAERGAYGMIDVTR